MIVVGWNRIEHPRWCVTRAWVRTLELDERAAEALIEGVVGRILSGAHLPWRR
jgi:hypothetical protein